ncbi:hypothetical protein [Luteolibacter soli]|uniref:PEP-CTERM protein-sorting domain-containing protein n=1 Tax=Luteolibacter soli TaxID=3135280 RepID=A0ABU9AZS8_9BACT
MKSFASRALAATVLAFAGVVSSSGSVVLQPSSVSTDMGALFPAVNTINQSGLSTGYTSLATDFDAYIASAPTAVTGFGAALWGAAGVHSGNFDFFLGDTYTVGGMAVWAVQDDPSAIRQVTIMLDDNALFSSPDYTGTFTFSNSLGDGGGNTGAQVISFSPTTASYVRFMILNTWGADSFGTTLNEAAFSVEPVPEPAMASIAGFAMIALFVRRKR